MWCYEVSKKIRRQYMERLCPRCGSIITVKNSQENGKKIIPKIYKSTFNYTDNK